MFSITLSYFEKKYEPLYVMGVITVFGESSFKFSFVSNGLMINSLGTGCTFEEVARKQNVKR